MRAAFALEVAAVAARMLQGAPFASPDDHSVAFRLRRYPAQGVLAAVLEDKRDGFGEACARRQLAAALTVGARNFRTVGDVPALRAFENRSEFISNGGYPLPQYNRTDDRPNNRLDLSAAAVIF